MCLCVWMREGHPSGMGVHARAVVKHIAASQSSIVKPHMLSVEPSITVFALYLVSLLASDLYRDRCAA